MDPMTNSPKIVATERASAFTVHLEPKYPAAIIPHDKCDHPGPLALILNTRTVRGKGGNHLECDARICMGCGAAHDNIDECADWFSTAAKFWKEFGWNRQIGTRLKQFADAATDTPAESFYALQYGMAPSVSA